MIAVVIMAAGKGTRMKSDLPKVLHLVKGKPLIEHVLGAARRIKPDRLIVIVGHQREDVMASVAGDDLQFAVQDPQLGTGHAVMQAARLLNNFAGEVVILSGDVPLLRSETLQQLVDQHRLQHADATVLSTTAPDPTGYGRILRDDDGRFLGIAEERDAKTEQKSINEINSGIYSFNSEQLFLALKQVRSDNAKQEYYLTDVLSIMKQAGRIVQAINIADFTEVMGINTVAELEAAEAASR